MAAMRKDDEKLILECSHCGNKTPHGKVFEYVHPMLFDEMDDQRYTEDYRWIGLSCSTCGGLNLYGDFLKYPSARELSRSKLYPKGFELLPPARVLNPVEPIPSDIIALYEQVWPLRVRSPAAFIGQVKRLLMLICEDQAIEPGEFVARMNDLFAAIHVSENHRESLLYLAEMIAVMGESKPDGLLDVWDMQVADDVFRLVLDIVYLIPAKIRKVAGQAKTG